MKTKHLLSILLLVFLITNTSFTKVNQETKSTNKINKPCISWVCVGHFLNPNSGDPTYVWVDADTRTTVEYCSDTSSSNGTFYAASGSYDQYTDYGTSIYCSQYGSLPYTGSVGFF